MHLIVSRTAFCQAWIAGTLVLEGTELENRAQTLDAPAPAYRPALKTLHWLIALVLLFLVPLGFLQKLVKEEVYETVNFWHVSLGFTLLLLMLVRLAVRLSGRLPPSPAGTPRWAEQLATWNHWLLYALLIIEPILGYLTTNAQGFPLVWFDLIPIWSPFGKSAAADTLLAIHLAVAWVIIVLIVLHVCGALYHHLVRRDDSLRRIL